MKNYITFFLIFIIYFAAVAQKIKSKYFENKILIATTQSWVAGVQGGGSGIIFNIEFKEEIPENIILEQLYYKNAKTKVTCLRGATYVANFVGTGNKREEKTLEYESQTKPIIIKPPFPIKENQAVLEYTFKNQKRYFIILNVKQIPSLEYPQTRPRD